VRKPKKKRGGEEWVSLRGKERERANPFMFLFLQEVSIPNGRVAVKSLSHSEVCSCVSSISRGL
jgi:hypothetical protein